MRRGPPSQPRPTRRRWQWRRSNPSPAASAISPGKCRCLARTGSCGTHVRAMNGWAPTCTQKARFSALSPASGSHRAWCVAIRRRGCWSRSGLPVRKAVRLAADCDRTIRQVANLLCQLHALTPPPGVRVVDFAVQARRLASALPAAAVPPALAACAEEVLSRLRPGRANVLCHHDVHAQNLVTEPAGRLWLVDWEYAGLGDPVFDLASCASQLEMSAASAGRLCDEYRRAGGTVEPARLAQARWAFDYVQWLWYRGLLATAAGPDEVEAAHRAGRIERGLQTRASGVLRCNNH